MYTETAQAFLSAQRDKIAKKTRWHGMRSGDDGYLAARQSFRDADDHCEALYGQVVAALQQAQVNDETDEVVDSLGADAAAELTRILAERGDQKLLDSTPSDLAGSISKYRRAARLWTASRQFNQRRRQFDHGDFLAILDDTPAGVDEKSWADVVKLVTREEQAIAAELGDRVEEVEEEDILSEAAARVETRLRLRYDALGDRLVALFSAMIQRGSFDREVAELDGDLRRVAYDFQRRVPMLQPKPQPRPDPRPLQLADAETDEEVLSAEDQAAVDDLLRDLGWT